MIRHVTGMELGRASILNTSYDDGEGEDLFLNFQSRKKQASVYVITRCTNR